MKMDKEIRSGEDLVTLRKVLPMRFETRSRRDGKLLFETIDRSLETAVRNSRNEALLHSINPDTTETVASSSEKPASRSLERFGMEWHVNSADYADRLPPSR